MIEGLGFVVAAYAICVGVLAAYAFSLARRGADGGRGG